jgi:DNA repair exonuclease SbcCD ATPase subunit
MLSARLEALVSHHKAVSDEPLPNLPPTVATDDVPRTPPEDRARIMEAKAERSQLRHLYNNIVFSSWDQNVTLMEPLLELAQTNRDQSTITEQLEKEAKESRENVAETRQRDLDRSWGKATKSMNIQDKLILFYLDKMQLELAVRPSGVEQRPDSVARSEAQEVDLQAAHQTIREFQRARAHLLQFIYSALMYEPEACTVDVFMADGPANIVEITAERLMRCRYTKDQIDGVHKATADKLEQVRARVQRLEKQIATAMAQLEKQDNIISAYIDEVTRRNERIAKLEADHQKAVKNTEQVLDTLEYVKANFDRVVRFGDEEVGDREPA